MLAGNKSFCPVLSPSPPFSNQDCFCQLTHLILNTTTTFVNIVHKDRLTV